MNYELSVLITARNEMWLKKTIECVLRAKNEKTEIIVGLDGVWSEPPIDNHKDVSIYFVPESIGQRAMLNQLARLSKAKYIMKLDAHCDVADKFDEVLIQSAQELGRNVTQVPLQYNHHAFDWVCPDGHRRYQSPSGPCLICGKETTMDVIWKRRESRKTYAWRFDKDMHFQYDRTYERKHPEEYVETMSCLGACWFLDREYFWELGGLDEGHTSWGQMGTEIGCKNWLTGGRLICNRKTWFSHMFRTQGGDFGFPYAISSSQQEYAREYSQDLWLNNKFGKQIYPLSWLIEKFDPDGWSKADLEELKKNDGIIGT